MIVYFGESVTVTVQGQTWRTEQCEHCGQQFHYRVALAAGYDTTSHTLAWADRINRSGAAYLTPAMLDGRWMVRVSIGAIPTEREHVGALWELMRSEAGRAEGG